MTVFIESDMEGNARVCGEAGRAKQAGVTVMADTLKASDLVQRMRSLIAKGKSQGIPDEYLKEQAQLFEEIVHILPKTIKLSAQVVGECGPEVVQVGKSDTQAAILEELRAIKNLLTAPMATYPVIISGTKDHIAVMKFRATSIAKGFEPLERGLLEEDCANCFLFYDQSPPCTSCCKYESRKPRFEIQGDMLEVHLSQDR